MQDNGPWKIKSSEIKYKNPWIEVREDQVIQPDGKDGIYSTVSFGKAGAHVLPFDEEGNVYLIQEFCYGLGMSEIKIVAGRIDAGETPLECGKRELQEEAGIQGSEWTELGLAYPLTSHTKVSNYMFIVRGLSFVQQEPEGTETIEVYKLSFEEAVAMVMDGRIKDEITSLLLLKARLFLQTT